MSNAYRMTKDVSLDRQYLRICAVYRATKRYGMDKATALRRLTERGLKERDAIALYEIWPHTGTHRDLDNPKTTC